MEHPDDKDLTPSEKLNAENEIEKAKMEMDGATFFTADDAPPELISQFLKNIKSFNAGLDQPQVTVREHLGNPKLPTDLPNDSDEFPVLLESIEKLCAEHGLNIIKPTHLKDYAIYRFIIEDILPHKIQPPVPGMTFVLDYDEFHEDSPHHMERVTQGVVESIIDLRFPFDEDFLSENCRTQKDSISKAEAINSITKFRDKYNEIIPVGFSLMEKEFTRSAMYQMFGIEWEGILKSNGEKETHHGMGICQLNLKDRKWLVEGVTFPGFDF